MVKVIGGKYRSRNLEIPKEGTVPTKNRVREAIFSACSDLLDDSSVLDLFAGSGALGIEALSRGAKKAVFVDNSPSSVEVIKSNLSLLKEKNGQVIQGDYLSALAKLSEQKMVFDLVFLDPPYAEAEFYQSSIDYLLKNEMLSKEAALVAEFDKDPLIDLSLFSSYRKYNYGKSNVIILRRPL